MIMAGKCALMLPGGGARGAYQVGAARALHEISETAFSPCSIMVGTSAGAINAAVLASHAHEFGYGVARLGHFWSTMHCGQIYRTDWLSVLRSAGHWMSSMLLGRLGLPGPKSLLDTQPLRELLHEETRLDGIETALERGALEAVAITSSAYTASRAVSFYRSRELIAPWTRGRRMGRPEAITVEHLMASAALPVLFPAVRLGNEFYGDGGLRQTSPLSPAIHLGAEKILVISTRDEHPDSEPQTPVAEPSAGDVAGHMLDILFMDNLQADLERIERVNDTLSKIERRRMYETHLRPIQVEVIRPSEDLRHLAARHVEKMPASVKLLLAGIGAWRPGTRLPSYLLFEAEYCQELMALGYRDAMAQRDAIKTLIDF